MFLAVAVILATHASRLMSGGVIPASTGRNVVSVGLMHPVKIRIVSFSAMSSFLVWVLRHQAGDAYSAGASQTAEETVPGVHFTLEAFEVFFVRQRPVESHTKVDRVVTVRKRSTVHKYIELSMCVPVI